MEELRMKHRLFLLGATALSLLFSCSRAEFEPMDSASGNEKTGRTVLEATAAGDLTPDSKTSFILSRLPAVDASRRYPKA